ncbi:unnamed protein product [Gadus morhua 'NCC']
MSNVPAKLCGTDALFRCNASLPLRNPALTDHGWELLWETRHKGLCGFTVQPSSLLPRARPGQLVESRGEGPGARDRVRGSVAPAPPRATVSFCGHDKQPGLAPGHGARRGGHGSAGAGAGRDARAF